MRIIFAFKGELRGNNEVILCSWPIFSYSILITVSFDRFERRYFT